MSTGWMWRVPRRLAGSITKHFGGDGPAKDDMPDWKLGRVITVVDRGFSGGPPRSPPDTAA